VSYSLNQQTAQWRIVDGEAVIVNVESSYYYGLNRTGTMVWQLIADGVGELDDIAAGLAKEYGIDIDRARDDARVVIQHLVAEELVTET